MTALADGRLSDEEIPTLVDVFHFELGISREEAQNQVTKYV